MQIFDKQYTTKKVSKFETDCNYFLGKLCRKKTNKTKKLYKQRKTITKTTKKREQKQMKSFYPIRSC